ncbi:oligosaccharide flippase family protein, partial [Vibrio breoganii]
MKSEKNNKSKAIRCNVLNSIVTLIIQLLSVSIASHTIDKASLGVYGIYLAVLSIGIFVAEMGMSTSIIKMGWKNKSQLTQLLLLNIAIAALLSSALYLSANYFEALLEANGLGEYIQLTAVAVFLSSISRFFIAINSFELKLFYIARVELVTRVLSSLSSLAYLIHFESMLGYAYSQILLYSSQLIILVFFIKLRLYFTMKISGFSIGGHVKFGLERTIESSTNQLTQNFDAFIIAKLFSLEVLGIYTIIKQITLKPLQIINPIFIKVYLPLLCKEASFISARYKYLEVTSQLVFISFFLLLPSVFLVGTGIIPLVKIDGESQFVFYILMCIWGGLRSLSSPIGMIYIATNNNPAGIKFNFLAMFIVFLSLLSSSFIGDEIFILGIFLLISQITILILQHVMILKIKFFEWHSEGKAKYQAAFIVLASFFASLIVFYFLVYMNINLIICSILSLLIMLIS